MRGGGRSEDHRQSVLERVFNGRMDTLPLDSSDATLANSGGKALNLVTLTRAGFDVPPGVIVTTDAYRVFVQHNRLADVIEAATDHLDASDPRALEGASAAIRGAFRQGTMPDPLAKELHKLAQGWAHSPLAVRSSATAEDLADASFAGQQDTYLNVLGLDALLAAVVDCWASLWTARALGYRIRNAIPPEGLALAVLVQVMIPSEVSGVMFTADPLTGHRGRTAIDATYGLGEALVSGQVEPDHWLVDSNTGLVITRQLGAKAVAARPLPDGGLTMLPPDNAADYCLTDAQLAELADVGDRLQSTFGGVPQDVEWAYADGRLHVLQSRAITSLYPLPSDDPATAWFSFGAFQGLLDPITPLGQDMIRNLAANGAALFGLKAAPDDLPFLHTAGERFWIRLDQLMRHPVASRMLPRIFGMVEPGALTVLLHLQKEPLFEAPAGHARPDPKLLAKAVTFLGPKVVRNLASPGDTRARFERFIQVTLDRLTEQAALAEARTTAEARQQARVAFLRREVAPLLARIVREFAPIMGPGILMTTELVKESAALAGEQGRALANTALRALPGNVTTEMDLTLWRTSQAIAADPASRAALVEATPEAAAAAYLAQTLPAVAQRQLTSFFDHYGMRGLNELDLGAPRWRERPAEVIRMVQGYLARPADSATPETLYAAAQAGAQPALDELLALAATDDRLGFKRRRLSFLVSRIRASMGARETPKFTLIRAFGLVRQGLLAGGADLVAAGRLDAADDIAFLTIAELAEAFTSGDLRPRIAARKAANAREQLRRQVPLVLVGDGRTFLSGISEDPSAIAGSPVSPGVAEGIVRVVLDPTTAALEPGEILVCPGTDPSWTPLFLTAAGLITEVGGMMTHGSVVAREYGIPAVVGVPHATRRLVTGQRVRIDGTTGTIKVL